MKLAVNTMRNLPVILTCLVLGGCNGDNSSSIQPIDVTDTQPFQSRHALTASNPTLDSCISNEEVIVKPHVVNIVSETAHAELLAALNAPSRGIPAKAAEVFYRYFPDDFDFLQFDVAGAPVSAVPFGAFFNAVKRPPIPALGFDTSRDTSRFFSTSRLKGVITATDSVAGRTATVHELFHYNDCTGFKKKPPVFHTPESDTARELPQAVKPANCIEDPTPLLHQTFIHHLVNGNALISKTRATPVPPTQTASTVSPM